MGRDKKLKKEKQEEDLGEEEVDDLQESTDKKSKRGKKGKSIVKEPESDERQPDSKALNEKGKVNIKTDVMDKDEEDGIGSQKLAKGAPVTKGKKGAAKVSLDDSDSEKPEGTNSKSKTNEGKGNQVSKYKLSDDEEEEETEKAVPKARKSVFELLDVEEMDSDKHDTEDEVEMEEIVIVKALEEKKGANKKSKKKDRKKKQDDDEEDLEKILEELALEIEGKKAVVPKEKELPINVESSETDIAESKKKKNKKGESSTVVKQDDVSSQIDVDEDKEGGTMKTAAQKKKEKKERERLKKLTQNEKDKAKKIKEPTPVEEDRVLPDLVPKVEVEEEDKEDEDNEKGGKKKKKKIGDEDKGDKKRPGKKQILAMQEALKKMKEEEERLRLEEEAKELAAQKAEEERLEKLQLEKERKERKKQKEKEKKERLKAEGKLLTKAQKLSRARMEATLLAFKQQGVDVPEIGVKRPPRLGDKRKPFRKKSEELASPEKDVQQVLKIEDAVDLESSAVKDICPEVESKDVMEVVEEVKDTWDESSGEEEKEEGGGQKKNVVEEQSGSILKEIKKEPENQDIISDSDDLEGEEDDEESSSDDDSDDSDESNEEDNKKTRAEQKIKEKAVQRIQRRKEEAEKLRSLNKLRSPVVCVLGHVDTGKTKILDKIRNTHVQDGEAGGITQQIGATMVPNYALNDTCKMVKNYLNLELKLPGLLIIDTPGHESFSNLRSRGSSLCDLAILVVDIMHGLEPQTIESLNMLKQRKTPFIVALNKIDRLYEWKSNKNKDIQDVIRSQLRNTKLEFDERVKEILLQFSEQAMNAALCYENTDHRSYVSLVPTSALSGDGMGNLLSLIVELSQSLLAKRLTYSQELQATVLEVKAIPGLGTTIDVILVNGKLKEGDTAVLAGHEGPVVTQIRSLLMPQPLKELRVKNPYQEFKEVEGAQGVKIAGKDLDKAIAGLQLLVAHHPDEVDVLKEEVSSSFKEAINAIKLTDRGVYVQASTLGSLEALLEFLRTSEIPYSGIRIGPVVKRDVMKASTMLEHNNQFAVILAFDVKIERDAQEMADSLGVKIFQANIIYHLFDKFKAYREELHQKKRNELKHVAVFPCKLRILPQFIFNSRDPIVVGVSVESGVLKEGTPLCIPSKENLEIGTVTTIELNHKTMDTARKGQEVCIKIEPMGGETPKMYGRHFDNTDMLVSKISRQSIDACKEYFRDDLQKTDWQLMVELKKLFQIL